MGSDAPVLLPPCPRGHPAHERIRRADNGHLRCHACEREYAWARKHPDVPYPAGTRPPRRRSTRLACPHGHPWTPENSYESNGKSRQCRTCARLRMQQRRGGPSPKPRATATTCAQGHPWTEASTYHRPDGGRACRICRTASVRRIHQRARSGD